MAAFDKAARKGCLSGTTPPTGSYAFGTGAKNPRINDKGRAWVSLPCRCWHDQQTKPHCLAFRLRERRSYSKQDHHVVAGISAQSADAHALCMHVVLIAPGGRGRAHLQEDHEKTISEMQGSTVCSHGDRLQRHFVLEHGEMAYIPASVAHLSINVSEKEPATCIVARTDADEWRAWSCCRSSSS